MKLLKKINIVKFLKFIFTLLVIIFVVFYVYKKITVYIYENEVLKQVINRLESDSRIAEVLVTGVNYDEATKETKTTIKLLEYDVDGQPLDPKYFTFTGNIIQFQSLVIRFDDVNIRKGDKLKGKSVYIFWKVFMLDGKNTQEYNITEINTVPNGYKISGGKNYFEEKLWQNFWNYALNPEKAGRSGIKNAQIEAPGTMFIPGVIYTIKIEHDGGLRIDTKPVSPILRGENIL